LYKVDEFEFGDNGFDVIVINFRGLADAKLKTPRLYCGANYEDVLEPI
jgi:predicted alpha/beta-fold hydrolase